ncbi:MULTISPECIES: Type-2Aa cytolytic delta-endotoxin [unclassified Streptomyces]|uniref:Type-2Aa cytolytic delta-endotoxin n=1 Tax=unclassified Streptomyces TaxID=2593676 RepID=UPI0022B5EC80|nr:MULTISPECIES: Type-2Aa cytolytic delta-endotoxin [unclassified Streptomyces]MCZ7415408.1 Type-2Aa cytolytic delta-endotoxin [Streptomyces sp. WMMC897]MCZ7417858.1 Type-2Aa cytolytic delta-endotoxin [Streptomyces sp. WMMC897]MCZ7417884.1 Type-2Aa cytolytic delta-endotoxin [Streptomyces sp. WMMC897]MCZ7432337.1 Type-2Aa cytolytic delta-endotoxin [Streptomyces sp. WMMC1477]
MIDQPAAEKTTFTTVFEVDPAHVDRAQGIADTFQHAIAPATVNFDFGEISRAASRIRGGSTVKIVRGWGLQETAPVSVMVLSLREAVRQALTDPFTNARFWERTEQALTGAFVDLGSQEGTHLSFYEDTPGRTSYYYNLLLTLQDEETGDDVYAVALCVDVSVALDGAKARALTAEDTAQFTVRLNAIALRQAPEPA